MHNHTQALPGSDDIVRRELDNGIVVLVRENHNAHSVVITGSINAGSLYDPADASGLATFMAVVMLRGTQHYDFATIHEMLEGNGASLSITGGQHTIGFSGKSLAEDLPMLVDLLADAVRRPVFPDEYVERMRGQIITSLKIREQDTRYMAEQTFRDLAYPADHPYNRRTSGTIDSVMGMTREQIVDFHRRQVGPRGMLVVIVGAVQAEDAIQLVQNQFGDWSNSSQADPPPMNGIPVVDLIREERVVLPGKSQADIVMGVPGPSRFVEDWHAVNLANSILGVFGMYGRIGTEVREKHGMAYYSYSALDGGLGPGAWRVIAGVNPANIEAAVAAIRKEVRRMTREPVSAEELADNKANFIGRLPLRLETNEGVAGSLIAMERYGLGLDYLRNYRAAINAVTENDVLQAAQRYFSPDVYALAVAGPKIEAG